MPFSPLPRYSGGEGLGVRGKTPSPKSRARCSPLTPDPSPPEYRGRGEKDDSEPCWQRRSFRARVHTSPEDTYAQLSR